MYQQNPSAAFQELDIVQGKVRELNRYQNISVNKEIIV